MLPSPPEMMSMAAVSPSGWRTCRLATAQTTASTMALVTPSSSHRIPEKLDHAAP